MKKTVLAALAVSLFACFALAGPPAEVRAEARVQQFVGQFVGWLKGQKVDVTPREQEALRDVHRLLLVAADDPLYFWLVVRNSPHEAIEWQDAKQMILRGQAVRVSQAHSRRVDLVTRDGRSYSTTEPKLDDVGGLIKEVDPKGVFIIYKTQ